MKTWMQTLGISVLAAWSSLLVGTENQHEIQASCNTSPASGGNVIPYTDEHGYCAMTSSVYDPVFVESQPTTD